ncbi:MAG: universal stress protein [Thermoanaerobaculia bacterium]
MTATKPKQILVPTDFSETARHAMRYASDLARRIGARLTVVYSDLFVPPVDYTATVGGWDEYSFDRLKATADDDLQREAKLMIDPTVPYDAVVRVAPPIEGILTQARESGAGMIVMGTHGRTGFRRLIIGSVTESVMRQAEVPVIVVPMTSEAKSEIRTVVCPAIYNDQCRNALNFAAAIAPEEATFIVIHSTPSNDVEETADDLAHLQEWVPESIATHCKLRVLGDRPLQGYAEKAGADLIVVAEPAERSASDVLYGTFAARVVQHSHCPVLTVNRPAVKRATRIATQEHLTEMVSANQ